MSFEQSNISSIIDDSNFKQCVRFSTPLELQTSSKSRHIVKLKKKKSRISLVLEKNSPRDSINEEETKCGSFSSGESSPTPDNNNNKITPSYITTIYISVMIKDIIKQISLNINSNAKISNIIDKAITAFNKEFIHEKVKIRIKDDPDLFVLKPAKKNGKPKTDFPFFNENITLHETHQEKFALCWKDNPDDFEQLFELQTKRDNCSCSIF